MPCSFLPRLSAAATLAGMVLLPWAGGALAQAEQDGSFNLTNRSNRAIERLYASPFESEAWGEDRLTGRPPLEDGASMAVRMPPDGGCRTDLRLAFAGGVVEERRDIDTCADRDVVIGTPARTGALRAGREDGATRRGRPGLLLRNGSGRVMLEFYASPSSQDDWGRDHLGPDTLRPNGRRAIRLPAGPCEYDLRAVWRGGRSEERREVDLCAEREITFR
ncbi:hypothetical protein [Roseomonas marmotae]|uniref:Tat pathway signal protein n=1 Tax=Roseomonas marmotae TaxID=2768161 RepID=A0ABS3KF27_9PROT|nr:hypothetical protein [Roseomonas marmotae]MBO1075602.1 hypothetical protein [Roseomonas marmotae]QTI79464.1 hypothetical protein IAI58_01160 [Roseomonas marmotae]